MANKETKVTNRDNFMELLEIITNHPTLDSATKERFVEFINSRVDQLDKKAAKAKEKAAEKKVVNDDLGDAVEAVLTEDFQSADDILNSIDAIAFPDATRAKVVARLTKLVNAGKAVKTSGKNEETGKKVMVYKIATGDEVPDAE